MDALLDVLQGLTPAQQQLQAVQAHAAREAALRQGSIEAGGTAGRSSGQAAQPSGPHLSAGVWGDFVVRVLITDDTRPAETAHFRLVASQIRVPWEMLQHS